MIDVVAQLYADKTFVVPPTSLNVVRHIAKDASRGKTADEIAPLLFDDNLDEQVPRPGTDVSILNASGVWISSQYPGSAEFDALFVRKYGGNVSRVNFQNGEGENAVGNWIAKLSNGDLHGLPLDGSTEFVIANIQVFEGTWVHPFDRQHIDLKIDEHGTVAKALTQFGKLQSLLPRHIALRFDRPFAFEIVRTGEHPVTLFEGQILDVPS